MKYCIFLDRTINELTSPDDVKSLYFLNIRIFDDSKYSRDIEYFLISEVIDIHYPDKMQYYLDLLMSKTEDKVIGGNLASLYFESGRLVLNCDNGVFNIDQGLIIEILEDCIRIAAQFSIWNFCTFK